MRKKIAFAIFDSRQKWGEGIGIQSEGYVEALSRKKSAKAMRLYIKRKYPYPNSTINVVKKFVNFIKKGKSYKFYKIAPETVWINDPNSKIDVRTEVCLN